MFVIGTVKESFHGSVSKSPSHLVSDKYSLQAHQVSITGQTKAELNLRRRICTFVFDLTTLLPLREPCKPLIAQLCVPSPNLTVVPIVGLGLIVTKTKELSPRHLRTLCRFACVAI